MGSKFPLKTTEDDNEEEEITRLAAEETSVDAAVVPIFRTGWRYPIKRGTKNRL